MSYPSNYISPQAVVDVSNKDANRLVGPIAEFVMQKDPYPSTMKSGTLSNESDVIRSAVTERALPSTSLVRPGAVPSQQLCGTSGGVTQVGSTEFSYRLEGWREKGPKVCVKTTRTSWEDSYPKLINTLRYSIKEVVSADIRAFYLDQSGCKAVMDSTGTFPTNVFLGDINAIGTSFPNRTPDSPVSFRALEIIATYMRETLDCVPYEGSGNEGNGEGAMLCIAGQDNIQLFRDEADIRDDSRALTTGKYAAGEKAITGYHFKGPYKGIAFGVDPKPLRATTLNTKVVSGTTYLDPVFIEPYTATATTTGYAARPNSSWTGATYEVMFLMGDDPARRLMPEARRIPGFNFSTPIANKGLEFVQIQGPDTDPNFWGDHGIHRYEIERAFRPEHPHRVCAILFKRAGYALNLTAV
jgi:hypothetical protein